MNDLIPNDVRSPEDMDDVLGTIGTLGIDVLERQPKLPSSVLKRTFEEEVEPGGGPRTRLRPRRCRTDRRSGPHLPARDGVVPLLSPKARWTLRSVSSADSGEC